MPSTAHTSSTASSSKPPAKTASLRKQHALVRLEQVVAPLQRRRQRLLSCRCGVAAAAQQAEAVVEPRRDRSGAQRAEPRGGELERERQAVEAEADACDVFRVLLVEHEARRRGGRALDEERHRLVARGSSGGERRSGSGMSSEGTRNTTSPGDAQRLAARRERSSAAAPSGATCPRARRSRRAGARSCRARAAAFAGEDVDHGVDRLLLGERTHVERSGDRIRRRAADPRSPRAPRAQRRPRKTPRRRGRARAPAESCPPRPSRRA